MRLNAFHSLSNQQVNISDLTHFKALHAFCFVLSCSLFRIQHGSSSFICSEEPHPLQLCCSKISSFHGSLTFWTCWMLEFWYSDLIYVVFCGSLNPEVSTSFWELSQSRFPSCPVISQRSHTSLSLQSEEETKLLFSTAELKWLLSFGLLHSLVCRKYIFSVYCTMINTTAALFFVLCCWQQSTSHVFNKNAK